MSLPRARLRYLSAMGLVLPSVAAVSSACRDNAPPVVATIDADATATTTAPTTATTLATPTAATATATAPPSTQPPIAAPLPDMPTCPSGKFCVPEPAKLATSAAPAPFGKCALAAPAPSDHGPRGSRHVTFSANDTTAARTKDKAACCYDWIEPCPGGRAFRDATGTPAVARIVEREDWVAVLGAIDVGHLAADVRAALAEHWTHEAAFEHASVASFAQLTLDLMSVGAPPELLAAAQSAALDEIEHARIAFALATLYGGRALGPAPLAASPGAHRTFAEIARTTFLDACVGESVASAALAEDARNAGDPRLAAALRRMADDEERHAELAWRIVAWALRMGGDDVSRALATARDEVIDELVALAHGVAAPTPGHELRATVLREVVLPCAVALVASAADPSAADARAIEHRV